MGEGRGALGAVSVVVPTFREAENIPALAESVRDALVGFGGEWGLLLSDDDSDDGSEALVADLSRRLPIRIAVRRGGPRDLSLAILDGIRLARFDRICVTDSSVAMPIRNLLARSLRRLGRLEEAAQEYLLVAELEPDNPEPLSQLANLRSLQGRNDEADELLRRAREMAPDSVVILQNTANSLWWNPRERRGR